MADNGFSAHITPVANKSHTCGRCRGHIVVGERHIRFTARIAGQFSHVRLHNMCETAMDAVDQKPEVMAILVLNAKGATHGLD